MKGHSKAEYYLEPKIALSGRFVPKSVQKCDRTSHAKKRSARTFQMLFAHVRIVVAPSQPILCKIASSLNNQ